MAIGEWDGNGCCGAYYTCRGRLDYVLGFGHEAGLLNIAPIPTLNTNLPLLRNERIYPTGNHS